MAKKREWVVRVVIHHTRHEKQLYHKHSGIGLLLEWFRYAGLVQVHRDTPETTVFDICCPHGLVSEVWAKMNAERIRSFGYSAQPAPADSREGL